MWKDEEIEILKNNYPINGVSSCINLLPNRTKQAIKAKAMKMGVKLSDDVKMRIAQEKGLENLIHASGSKNHNWKGGEVTYNRIEYKKKTNEKYPERKQAREKVRVAIKNGLIIKVPCIVCGDTKSEAHHEDYSKPLDVVFLCRKHHVEADKNRGNL